MPMDGILLNRITSNIEKLVPLRISRITQPSNTEFVFNTFGKVKHSLYISVHPRYGRIQFTDIKNSSNIDMTHFLTILRKYLNGGVINKVEQSHFDRIITLHITSRDDVGVIKSYRLILELMGRYANLIVVGDDDRIIDAHRRLSDFESSERNIVPGASYALPPSFDKKSIEDLELSDKFESIRTKYEGISPILEKEIQHRLDSQTPEDIVKELLSSDVLYLYPNDYHIIELTHLNQPTKTMPLMEGLDYFYEDLQNQERIKAHTGNILKTLRRELKRAKSKLPKLYNDLDNAENSEHYREKGDILFAYHAHAKSGLSSVELEDFNGEPITIALDEKLSGKDNANKYFTRYRKAKNSLSHLENQIDLTENRIEYLETLLAQTELASVEDAKEIQEELISSGILFQKKNHKKKKQKKSKRPNYMVVEYDENTTIFIGKNNIQNDTLTFQLGKKEDLWFHVAHTFGSHVLLKTDEITQEKLDLCANFAVYFSNARNSSNVEVNYTEIKNIKKIPGSNPGTVRFSTHKSLIITPDETIIKAYLKQ